MIDTTEETGGDAIKYYAERTAFPEFNIVLDSKYPAVVAEKGSGALKVLFQAQAADGKLPAIVAMSGAASANTFRRPPPHGSRAAIRLAWRPRSRARVPPSFSRHEPRRKLPTDVSRSADGINKVTRYRRTAAPGRRSTPPRLALFP
jgi:hypothetical protein